MKQFVPYPNTFYFLPTTIKAFWIEPVFLQRDPFWNWIVFPSLIQIVVTELRVTSDISVDAHRIAVNVKLLIKGQFPLFILTFPAIFNKWNSDGWYGNRWTEDPTEDKQCHTWNFFHPFLIFLCCVCGRKDGDGPVSAHLKTGTQNINVCNIWRIFQTGSKLKIL